MKTFTIEQAEKHLPDVEKLVKKARRLRSKIAWILESNDAIAEVNTDGGFHFFVSEYLDVNKKFHRFYYQFYKAIEELNKIGVIVKDIDEGIIDFPFKGKSEDAFLCWQLGEDKICHWHSDNCFGDRKRIVDVDEFFESTRVDSSLNNQ